MSFRIGLIGAGLHGVRYLRPAVHDVPGVAVAAPCRRDETAGRRLAAEFGCRYHADPAALIADPAVDGVVVCTPPGPSRVGRNVVDQTASSRSIPPRAMGWYESAFAVKISWAIGRVSSFPCNAA